MKNTIGTTNKRAVTCSCGNRIDAGKGQWNGQRFECPTCAPAYENTKAVAPVVEDNTLVIPEMTKTDVEKLIDASFEAIFEADNHREEIDASRDGAIVFFQTFSMRTEVLAVGTTYKIAKAGSERAAIEGVRDYGLSPVEAKLFFSKKIDNNKWIFTWTVKGTM